ncbi:MAG: hypothetical protein PHG54_05005, partial [Smithellaceae bacterium]|nr:hypothetical protein [Smithellaceae bacterium]
MGQVLINSHVPGASIKAIPPFIDREGNRPMAPQLQKRAIAFVGNRPFELQMRKKPSCATALYPKAAVTGRLSDKRSRPRLPAARY